MALQLIKVLKFLQDVLDTLLHPRTFLILF